MYRMINFKKLRMRISALNIFGGIFLIIGVVILLCNVVSIMTWKTSTATIVGIEVVSSISKSSRSTSYLPVVEFVNHRGELIRTTIRQSGDESQYSIGASLPILYSPYNSQKVHLNSNSWLYLFPIMFIIAGSIIIGLDYMYYKEQLDAQES